MAKQTLKEILRVLSEGTVSRSSALKSEEAYKAYKEECEKKTEELYSKILGSYGIMYDTGTTFDYSTVDKALAWVTRICSDKKAYDEEFRDFYTEAIGPKSDYLKNRAKALKLSPAQRVSCAKLICQGYRIRAAMKKTENDHYWKNKKK